MSVKLGLPHYDFTRMWRWGRYWGPRQK